MHAITVPFQHYIYAILKELFYVYRMQNQASPRLQRGETHPNDAVVDEVSKFSQLFLHLSIDSRKVS